MKHQPVESSTIQSVAHCPDTQTLEVKFHSGGTYHYHGVPADLHSDLMNSDSVGKFLNSRIKGHYPHEAL